MTWDLPRPLPVPERSGPADRKILSRPGEAVRTGQFGAASRGELQMVVHEVLPLEQAVLAHRKMETGEVFGRIVLVPSG